MNRVAIVSIEGSPEGVSKILETYYRCILGAQTLEEVTTECSFQPVAEATDAATPEAVNTQDVPQEAETQGTASGPRKRGRKPKTESAEPVSTEAPKEAEPVTQEAPPEPVKESQAPVSSGADEFGLDPSDKDYHTKLMDLARSDAQKVFENPKKGTLFLKRVLKEFDLPNVQSCPTDKLPKLIEELRKDG